VCVPAPRPSPPAPPQQPPPVDPTARQNLLDDPKLNAVLAAVPGATITEITEVRP
jgi:hypothetical protein